MDASTRTISSRLLSLSLLVALLSIGSVAQRKASTENEPVARPTPGAVRMALPARAQLSFCADQCSKYAESFKIDSLRDLNIVVTWTSALGPGTHVQKLELVSPSGEPYQQLETRFDTRTVKQTRLGQTMLRSSIPIAGSWIQQRSVAGNWKVNVYLDDKLVTSGSLTLQ